MTALVAWKKAKSAWSHFWKVREKNIFLNSPIVLASRCSNNGAGEAYIHASLLQSFVLFRLYHHRCRSSVSSLFNLLLPVYLYFLQIATEFYILGLTRLGNHLNK